MGEVPKSMFGTYRVPGIKNREIIRWFQSPDLSSRRIDKALEYYGRKRRGMLDDRGWDKASRPVLIHKGRKP